MSRVEIVTEAGYWEGESNLDCEVYVYDAVTYGDLDSNIEKQIKEAGGQIIVVGLKEKY